MTPLRWLIICGVCLVFVFWGFMLGYTNEDAVTEDDKKEAPGQFGWLEMDKMKPRLLTEEKTYTNSVNTIDVGSACGRNKPLRLADFTLTEGASVRIVYKRKPPPANSPNCPAPKGLAKTQEFCLFSTKQAADAGSCKISRHKEGALAVGPDRGKVELSVVSPTTSGTQLPFKVKVR